MEGTIISVYKGNATIDVFVNNDLSKPMKEPFGSIIVTDGSIGKADVFWDNLKYFEDIDLEKEKSMIKELIDADQYYKGVIEDIKYIMDRVKNDLKIL